MTEHKGVIFCDLAGTITFQNKHNNMFDVKKVDDVLVDLRDPVTHQICRVMENPVQTYKMYTDPETLRLLEEVKKSYMLVYVTGSRPSSMDILRTFLVTPHATLMENGAVVMRNGFDDKDEAWSEKIESEIRELLRFIAGLKQEGWIVDDKGRTSAVRIFPSENPERSGDDFNALAEMIAKTEPSIKTTWNIGGLDVIPKSAGKGNAVKYHMGQIGCSFDETIGIGDDINDMEMFEVVKERLIVKSFHEEILSVARKNNWFISESVHFAGINEILRNLLAR